jgi:hypothetical protein
MPESGAGPKVGPTLQSYMAPRRLVGARFSATRWNEFFGFSIEDFRNPVIYIPPACLRASAGQQQHDPHRKEIKYAILEWPLRLNPQIYCRADRRPGRQEHGQEGRCRRVVKLMEVVTVRAGGQVWHARMRWLCPLLATMCWTARAQTCRYGDVEFDKLNKPGVS